MFRESYLGIDFGTSTIRIALVNNRSVVGIATGEPRGIKGGNIVNYQSAKDSFLTTLNRLRLEVSSSLPKQAYVVVPGNRVVTSVVETKISFPGIQTITYNDVNELKNKVKKSALKKLGYHVKNHYEVIHIIPQEFAIENLTGIQNPIGSHGKELSMRAFVVFAPKSTIQTYRSILKEAGIELKGVVLQSISAFYGIRDERTYFNNILIICLGAGNTEYLFMKDDYPVIADNIPFGGEDILETIVNMLKVSRKEAERLVYQHGSADVFRENKEDVIDINLGLESRKVPKYYISAIIHKKLKEKFKQIKEKLLNYDENALSNLSKVILVGGLSKLKNIELLTEREFKAPAVVPSTTESAYADPSYAVVVGIRNYLVSVNDRKRLVDVKEDLTKSYSFGWGMGLWKGFLRFIMDII